MSRYADLIIKHAKIYTSDDKQPWAENLAVKGDRFIFAGNVIPDDLTGSNTRVFDAGGRLIIPGMIDGHTHIEPVALSKWRVALPRTSNLTELLEAAAGYCREHPPEEVPYFFGENYFNEMFDERGPTKELLDKYISDRPARLQDFTDHACWFNSMAIDYLGITKNTPNPSGPIGEIEFVRDAEGNPTGWVKEPSPEGLEDSIYDKIDWKPAEQISEIELRELLQFFSSHGIICLFDGLTEGEHLIKLFHSLDQKGELNLYYEGSCLLASYEELENAVRQAKDWRKKYKSRHVDCRTVKFFLDGTNELGDSASLEPFYNDASGKNYGVIHMTEDELADTIIRLNREDLDFHIHMVCDRAFRTGCNAVERAKRNVEHAGEAWSIYVTFTHCELVNPDDIKRAAGLGIIINWTPHWSGGYFGEAAASYLGTARWNTMYDFTGFLKTGATVTFGSDIFSGHEQNRGNPYFGMECAHTRIDPRIPA